jgi:hypothetical protein
MTPNQSSFPFAMIHFQAPFHPTPSLHVYSESDAFPWNSEQQARRGWVRFS